MITDGTPAAPRSGPPSAKRGRSASNGADEGARSPDLLITNRLKVRASRATSRLERVAASPDPALPCHLRQPNDLGRHPGGTTNSQSVHLPVTGNPRRGSPEVVDGVPGAGPGAGRPKQAGPGRGEMPGHLAPEAQARADARTRAAGDGSIPSGGSNASRERSRSVVLQTTTGALQAPTCPDLGEAPDRSGVTGEGGSTPPLGASPARGAPRTLAGGWASGMGPTSGRRAPGDRSDGLELLRWAIAEACWDLLLWPLERLGIVEVTRG